MKELVVLRHAEAGGAQGRRDHDRPLTRRGERAASEVGERLRRAGVAPGITLSSTALRATATARRVIEACGGRIALIDRLYLAPPQTCLEEVASRGDPHATVLLVGHNPGLEDLVALLGGSRVALAPAGLVRLRLDLPDWIEILKAPRGRRV